MLGVGVLLAVAVAIVRLSFSLESPRYYISRGEYTEAEAAATQLLESPITITAESEPPIATERPTYGELLNAHHRRSTLLASVPWFLQDIATYGVGIFTPAIIGLLAFASEPDFLMREIDAATGSAVVDLFLIVGFLCALLLVEKLGRIRLQIIGFVGMAVGLGILASSSLLPAGSRGEIGLVISGFLVFNLLMNAGPNATTFLLSGEVFPTSIRATGAGFAAAFAKAGAVIGTFGLPILQQSLGVPWLLIALSGCCLVAALLTFVLRIETTGRSLETVQELAVELEIGTLST
jgi:hypothetical protein